MNTTALEPDRWTRRRWVYAVAAIFAVQAIFMFALGRRSRPAASRPIFPTAVQIVPGDLAASHGSNQFALDDPTLLALPNLRGFSGPAWLQFAPLEYQPGEWAEPPYWLALNERSLGAAFAQFLTSSSAGPPLAVDKPLPPLQRYEPNFPNEPVPAQSRLRIEGALAGRRIIALPELPSWPNSELLSNSVVRVSISADGSTFSPVLLTESGHAEADRYALKAANELRFQPISPGPLAGSDPDALTWGRLVFQWHTLPLPAANAPLPVP